MLLDSGRRELPITDRRMTRFWISLDQAVDLVFKALEESRGGETYISKIPSFKVVDLAAAMSAEAQLKDVGIREGEKVHEIMITEYDSLSTREYQDHYIIYPNSMEWWTESRLTPGGAKVTPFFRYSSDENSQWLTVEDMKQRLAELEIVF
jgi:FlaA1/EpsC-like NDP-sugar epimerase